MKKKLLFFASLVALSLSTWQVQAVNINSVSTPINTWDVADPPAGYEKIDLQGTLMLNIGPNAIVAGASDNDVYIGFNQSFGNVNISIRNGMGALVYSTVVDTNVQQVIIIQFSNVSGSYTVELSNIRGYADGDFERE